MPWQETNSSKERREFIQAWLTQRYSMSLLCTRFGVSRKTGYKWLNRFKSHGMNNLNDQPRTRHHQAHRTSAEIVQKLIDTKLLYPKWGPRKVTRFLHNNHPQITWPAISTTGTILAAEGLVEPRGQRRYKAPARTAPLAHATSSNRVWSVDFKGDFLLGNARRCYPLTVFDNHSRYLLACKGLYSTRTEPVIATFEMLFREFGLPDYLRSDNGCPFASTRIGGLSRFSLWVLKCGVTPERIRPGRPQENGRHERFHRSLKAAVCHPPKGNLSAQQRAFNRYQCEYNQDRPHEALADTPPGWHYTPSSREYSGKTIEFCYPDTFAIRKVRADGNIKWKQAPIYVANLLVGEHIGLEPIDNGCWMVYLSTLKLGILDERINKIIRPGK